MDSLNDEKRFYERFYALHRDPVLLRIFEHFSIDVFRRSSVLEGFDAFLRKHEFKGGTCLEIGTLKGLTAIVLARYFERVVTVDIVEDPQRLELAAFAGVDNIEFVHVRDNAHKALTINSRTFDAAYIDGDHAHDTRVDFELVRRCGRVLFHEAWTAQSPVLELLSDLEPVIHEGKFALWTN